ncbi:MAG: bifunctional demethylmenaquinone methyltransferase/2-methoxy-6-polyprenyl-1,4-benzoquinol methylase UbiE [Bacteroidales bacterium]|nr:bifunctional demethylmenaquinone methyltransferase/2-methoxy-6-polyprenyl-1,4-benzoquinol methylase UbiE [Bacteroidales bacterium]
MRKKEKIRNLFDNIAPAYDRLNHLLSFGMDKGWRRKAVREITDISKPLSVLDVACGTGDFTIDIARHAAYGSRVVGIDLSEEMMKAGRAKIESAGLEAVLEYGDGEALPYEDLSFERVSIGFGIRNFEHPDRGLAEMFRVLKAGGRLVILELSVPSNSMVRRCYKLYALHILPVIGGWVSGDHRAYRYLPASVIAFPAPDIFMRMMREAGFRNVRQQALTFGVCRMYVGEK